jgi:hypothetical protein
MNDLASCITRDNNSDENTEISEERVLYNFYIGAMIIPDLIPTLKTIWSAFGNAFVNVIVSALSNNMIPMG